MNKVFLSFKNTDEDGNTSQEALLAQQLYAELMAGPTPVPTFFSNITLLEFGEAAYKDAIEKALDEAVVLVVIACTEQHLTSRWIKYEWNSFHEEILSGDKKDGVIVPYLHSSIARKDRPLALRNLETFATDQDGVKKVADFVRAYLEKKTPDSSSSTPVMAARLGSSYNPVAYAEHERLRIQAQNTRPADMPALRYVFEELGAKPVYVLDIGCAYGYVTFDRFGDFANATVLGIDKQPACVQYARQHAPDARFSFAEMDLESPDFLAQMQALMAQKGIDGFHLVFATLVLHHLKDPVPVLRNLRKLLASDGFILVRGSDDGSIVAYGDDGLVQKIVDRHLATPGISDRKNGRKIYYQLYTSGYKQIRMFNYVKQIAGLDFDERLDVFNERFGYRKNYLLNRIKEDPANMEYRNQLEWMEYALGKLEELFGNDSFWYEETDFVAVARKK